MTLLTQSHHATLLANGRATRDAQLAGHDEPDHRPVVKLFTPDANATWLLTELDPDEPDIALAFATLASNVRSLVVSGCRS